MTEQQQRCALAEWEGWKFTQGSDGEFHSYLPTGEHCDSDFADYPMYSVPDYLHDLNAVWQLEEKLDDRTRVIYYSKVYQITQDMHNPTNCASFDLIHATATQRCEALLKTLGLWKEGE